ncbi:MAG: 30S ribosomal protein S12 methylthiotransferase RimO, partial [Thermonemataceae bacterium]
IMSLQNLISQQLIPQKIVLTFIVLFYLMLLNYFFVITYHDSPEVDNEVLVEATEETYTRIGDFASVHIHQAAEFDLYGTLSDHIF